MISKMLRIAGRTKEGITRALRVNNDGKIEVNAHLTGSIVKLLDDELEVPNAKNMFIGSSTSTSASMGRGLLIENFKGISLYIRNNTDDDFVINNLYQGTSETPGSLSGRRRYYFDFGITVTSGSHFSVDFRDPDDDLNNI